MLLLLVHRLTARFAGAGPATVATLLLAVSPPMAVYSTQVLSDVPFAAALLALLGLLLKECGRERTTSGTALAIGAAAGTAMMLREVGIALAGAVVIFFLLRRERQNALLAGTVVLAIAGLWYVRNEVLVAGRELPELRNTRLLFGHVLTDDNAGLAEEFIARARTNVAAYAPLAGALPFVSQYAGPGLALVPPESRLVQTMSAVVASFYPVFASASLLLALAGLLHLRRSQPRWTAALAAFLVLYTLLILLYPVVDERFLFPVYVLVPLLMGAGIARVDRSTGSPLLRGAVRTIPLLLALPGLFWTAEYLRASLQYRGPAAAAGAGEFLEYGKRFDVAGEWVRANTPPEATIGSCYLEAGLWTGGRKVFAFNPLVPPQEFEATVRDYEIGWLIVDRIGTGVRDLEYQMMSARRFSFERVYETGSIEVLRVAPWTRKDTTEGAGDDRAVRGWAELRSGRYDEAGRTFREMRSRDGFEDLAIYFEGVAAEFGMRLREAEEAYSRLTTRTQALVLVRQADIHRGIIVFLDSSRLTADPTEKASFLHSASLAYWVMGYRERAREVLAASIGADSGYFVGPVFAALIALEAGEGSEADRWVTHAEQLRPGDPIATELRAIHRRRDSLAAGAGNPRDLWLGIARSYRALGLNDPAIDACREAAAAGPHNREAWVMLAEIFISRGKTGPARAAITRLSPGDPARLPLEQALP